MGYEPIFKKLPFYRILTSAYNTTLLSPPQRQSTYLTREFFFSVPEEFKERFSNTAKRDIHYQNTEIQLRFCRRLSNLKSCHEIDDYIPPELDVYVNCSIPDLPPFVDSEQKLRKAHPINITDSCTVSKQNQITMSWFSSQSDNYEYYFAIHVVERVSYKDIVKSMSTSLESDLKYLVLKRLGGGNDTTFPTNSDLCVTSLTVSLLCPLSMQRIKVPSRSIYCTHVQCFDVFNYLQINEFKPSWKCPVCRDKAPFDTLIIDGMFKKILKKKNVANEIVFAADGSWESSPDVNDLFEKDSDSEEDDDFQQKSDDSKSVLNLQKLTNIRSSPRIQKRLITNSPRTQSKSSTPQTTPRRRKQKLVKSSPYISDVIKEIKNRNTSTLDVVDLT